VGRRILMLLADEYRPDPRVRKEALALVEDGNEVSILLWDRGHNHEASSKREEVGIECVRTRKVRGIARMMINYPLFFLKALIRSRKLSFDTVHAHDLDTLLLGLTISRLRRASLVYDAHEHYAEMVASEIPQALVRFLDLIEARMVEKADLLIGASSMIIEYLKPHTNGPSIEILNCIDLVESDEINFEEHDGITVFYGGSLESTRYVDSVVEAVLEIEHCRYRIAGDGPLREYLERISEREERIQFVGYISHSELLESLSDVDLILCLLDPKNENNRIGMPNKLFESMALGIPVLVSEGTLSAEVAREEKCGISIVWNIDEFKKAIEELKQPGRRKTLGMNGKKAAREKYNWGIMKKRLIDAYRSLSP
jgi:glycosyltransferase involved in cell wall biosynthesis